MTASTNIVENAAATEPSIEELFSSVVADLATGLRALHRFRAFERFADDWKQHDPDWLTSDEGHAPLVRRIEAIRANGMTPAPTLTATITVEELAAGINQSVGATRKLLDKVPIPGARRKTPGVKNSPWIIPADAPQRYLAQFDRGEE